MAAAGSGSYTYCTHPALWYLHPISAHCLVLGCCRCTLPRPGLPLLHSMSWAAIAALCHVQGLRRCSLLRPELLPRVAAIRTTAVSGRLLHVPAHLLHERLRVAGVPCTSWLPRYARHRFVVFIVYL